MRINQFVAATSGLSRRAADAAITAGQVNINNQMAVLGQSVAPTDRVTYAGKILTPPATRTYILLNKPAGYVCSRARQGSNPTVYDLLPPSLGTLRIAGRLDLESSGLLILSDDGDFIQQLSHPSNGKTKRYELTLGSPLSSADHAKLNRGIKLRDGTSFVKVISVTDKSLVVSLEEGRNRQLRRTFGTLGYTVERLNRVSIGSYQLGSLASGAWQKIAAPEVTS